jgi:nitroreductase
MNATLDLLRTRRSVPPLRLDGPGPDAAELDALLTIAARVPDHGKLAPWRFLVIAGDARTRIGDAIAAAYAADHPEADAARRETASPWRPWWWRWCRGRARTSRSPNGSRCSRPARWR